MLLLGLLLSVLLRLPRCHPMNRLLVHLHFPNFLGSVQMNYLRPLRLLCVCCSNGLCDNICLVPANLMSDVSTRLWITVLDGILCIWNADSLIDLDPFFDFSWWWFLGSFEGDKNQSIPFPALCMVLLFSVLTLLVFFD